MLRDILVDNAKEGNQKAYKELFDENVNNLYRYLRQFSNDRDQVDDWVQRAFIKAFKNILSFHGNSTFRTWLFKIGINEMRSDIRTSSKKSSDEFEENLHGDQIEPENNFEWHEEMKWLLSDLDETKKNIFILYEVEGYKHNEIADMLDISESASKTILHRTRKILQDKWLQNQR